MPRGAGWVAIGMGDDKLGRREGSMNPRNNARLYAMAFASVYPLYIEKAEKKGRSRDEVDEVIRWLTGYSQEGLEQAIAAGTSFADFFAHAPAMNPARTLVTGVICGVRVEEIEEQPMREIRTLDKLVDELAKGKTMGKVLRG